MLDEARHDIVWYCLKMLQTGLTSGTGGNISVFNRRSGKIALTPSGVEYDRMNEEDIVISDLDGNMVEGKLEPTSEKDLHFALYRCRPDVNAVVHVHSEYAATLASLGWEIPPFSYLVAVSGRKVPVVPYAPFGSVELAQTVSVAMSEYQAVLMGNHGLVSVGKTLRSAYSTAETVEYLAGVYWRAKCAGDPVLLDEDQIEDAIRRFKAYGQSSDM